MAALGAEAAKIAQQIDWNGAETQDYSHEARVAALREQAKQILGDDDPIDAHFHVDPGPDGTPRATMAFRHLSGKPLEPEEAVTCEIARALIFTVLDHAGPDALDVLPAVFGVARKWLADTILQCAADPAWAQAIATAIAGWQETTPEALAADIRHRFGAHLTHIPGTLTATEAEQAA